MFGRTMDARAQCCNVSNINDIVNIHLDGLISMALPVRVCISVYVCVLHIYTCVPFAYDWRHLLLNDIEQQNHRINPLGTKCLDPVSHYCVTRAIETASKLSCLIFRNVKLCVYMYNTIFCHVSVKKPC